MVHYIVHTISNATQALIRITKSVLCHDSSNTINMSNDELYDWIGLKGSTEKQRIKRIQYIKHRSENDLFSSVFLKLLKKVEYVRHKMIVFF